MVIPKAAVKPSVRMHGCTKSGDEMDKRCFTNMHDVTTKFDPMDVMEICSVPRVCPKAEHAGLVRTCDV